MPHLEELRLAARQRWLDGSAFAEAGEPQLWFHGTDCHEFNVFTRWEEFSIGFHFGGAAVANSRIADIGQYADEDVGIIIPVICRAANPLRLKDHHTWNMRNVLSELEHLGIVDDDAADMVLDHGDAGVFAAVELAGYDSAIYLNVCEHKETPTDSLIVWRAELLKSPYAASFELEDPRILPQANTDEADIRAHGWLANEIASAKEQLLTLRTPKATQAAR